jgi:hypothetical protein
VDCVFGVAVGNTAELTRIKVAWSYDSAVFLKITAEIPCLAWLPYCVGTVLSLLKPWFTIANQH